MPHHTSATSEPQSQQREVARHDKCTYCGHAYFRHLGPRYDERQPCTAFEIHACACPTFVIPASIRLGGTRLAS